MLVSTGMLLMKIFCRLYTFKECSLECPLREYSRKLLLRMALEFAKYTSRNFFHRNLFCHCFYPQAGNSTITVIITIIIINSINIAIINTIIKRLTILGIIILSLL